MLDDIDLMDADADAGPLLYVGQRFSDASLAAYQFPIHQPLVNHPCNGVGHHRDGVLRPHVVAHRELAHIALQMLDAEMVERPW